MEDEACAQFQKIEDAEAVFCFTDGRGGNRIYFRDAVICKQLAEACNTRQSSWIEAKDRR